jgi:putative restriction endonuclease
VQDPDPAIFCSQNDWIQTPGSWSPNIVSFKTYTTEESDGLKLWDEVSDQISRTDFSAVETPSGSMSLGS